MIIMHICKPSHADAPIYKQCLKNTDNLSNNLSNKKWRSDKNLSVNSHKNFMGTDFALCIQCRACRPMTHTML